VVVGFGAGLVGFGFSAQHAEQSAFALFGVAGDQVYEDCALKELQEFFDRLFVGEELQEELGPAALLLCVEGFGARRAAPAAARYIHDEEQSAARLRRRGLVP
jgi:hypothetical protein